MLAAPAFQIIRTELTGWFLKPILETGMTI